MDRFSIIPSYTQSNSVNLQSILAKIKRRSTQKVDIPLLANSPKTPLYNQGSFQKAPNLSSRNPLKQSPSNFSQISTTYGSYSKPLSLNIPPHSKTSTTNKFFSIQSSSRLNNHRLKQQDNLQKQFTFSINNQNTPKIQQKDRINNLSKSKLEVWQSRQKLKREKQDQELLKLSRGPNSVSSLSSFPQRLYLNSESKRRSLEKTNNLKQPVFSFKPKLNKTSQIIGSRSRRGPLYRRASEIHRYISTPKQRPLSPECSFKPLINEKSRKLAKIRNEKGVKTKIFGSLSSQKGAYQNNKKKQDFESKIKWPSYYISNQNFLERQQKSQVSKQVRRKALLEKLEKHTYKPQINTNSEYIVQANSCRINQTLQDKCWRMSSYQVSKRDLQNKILANQQFAQYSFSPAINSMSKQIGRNSGIEILTETFKPKTRLLARQKALQQERQCVFNPKINRPQKKIESILKNPSKISENLKEKRQKVSEKKKKLVYMKEFKQMKECTFAPKCNSGVKIGRNSVKVKGMQRVNQLKAILERQKTERQKREQKAFLVKSQLVSTFPHTYPVPFNINPSKRVEKVLKIQKLKMLDDDKIFTFKPALVCSKFKDGK